MGIAFFDFDQTLISVNSARMWIRREVALGQISKSQAVRAGLWLLQYELGFAAMEQMVGRAIAALAGTRERDIRERTVSFYERQVRGLFRPEYPALAQEERGKQKPRQTVQIGLMLVVHWAGLILQARRYFLLMLQKGYGKKLILHPMMASKMSLGDLSMTLRQKVDQKLCEFDC